MQALAAIYAESVNRGERKLENIPAVVRPLVAKLINPTTTTE